MFGVHFYATHQTMLVCTSHLMSKMHGEKSQIYTKNCVSTSRASDGALVGTGGKMMNQLDSGFGTGHLFPKIYK